jgi:hypothetical protein
LVWASYLATLGIDLDSNTSPFGVGVSPDDLWHSQYTSVIAAECADTTFDASAAVMQVSVLVDHIYYTDDYDPWPKGAGEMYLISRTGLGITDNDGNFLATEEGYPGSGKIGDTPDGTWALDEFGPLYWNTYFNALIPVDRDLRICIEAWEEDDDSADDQYPICQWYYPYATWQNYIDQGWYTSDTNQGDCIYTISWGITTIASLNEALSGDANGDGMINVSDVIWIINYVLIGGSAPQPYYCCGDVNGDSLVNISDAVYLINYLVIPDSPGPIETCTN